MHIYVYVHIYGWHAYIWHDTHIHTYICLPFKDNNPSSNSPEMRAGRKAALLFYDYYNPNPNTN